VLGQGSAGKVGKQAINRRDGARSNAALEGVEKFAGEALPRLEGMAGFERLTSMLEHNALGQSAGGRAFVGRKTGGQQPPRPIEIGPIRRAFFKACVPLDLDRRRRLATELARQRGVDRQFGWKRLLAAHDLRTKRRQPHHRAELRGAVDSRLLDTAQRDEAFDQISDFAALQMPEESVRAQAL